jgi:hypothetical protein
MSGTYTEEEILEQIKNTFVEREYEVTEIRKMNKDIYDVYVKDPKKRHNGADEIKFEFFVTNREKKDTE